MHQSRIIITHIVLLFFLLLLPSNSIRILLPYHKQQKQVFFSIIAGSSFYSSFLLIIYTKMNTELSDSGDCFIFILTTNIHHYDFGIVYSYHLFLLNKWLNGIISVFSILFSFTLQFSTFTLYPLTPLRSKYLLLLFYYFLQCH